MMKVLMTTDNIGGVWTYAINLSRGLISKGIDVNLVVIGNELTTDQRKELDFLQWYSFNCKQEWMEKPWDDIERTGRWLLSLKEKLHPDIIHLNSYSYGSLNWNVPVIITAHSCVLSWWKSVKKESAPAEWDLYNEYVTKGIHGANLLVAPSNTMMKAIENIYNPGCCTKVIYNGIDSSGYTTGIKENYIFSMGRLWDEAKNIKLVIKAAPEINYPLFIAGENAHNDFRKLPDNVNFTGHLPRSDISGFLSKASVYLLPVIYEPFGYTFLEAAVSNCALIAGDIVSMREIWEDAALYVDTSDHHALANKVNTLMADIEQLAVMAEKARQKALSKYSLNNMTSEYIKLYQELFVTA